MVLKLVVIGATGLKIRWPDGVLGSHSPSFVAHSIFQLREINKSSCIALIIFGTRIKIQFRMLNENRQSTVSKIIFQFMNNIIV